jgi:hypothetical protein
VRAQIREMLQDNIINPLTFVLRKGKIARTCLDAPHVIKWPLTYRASALPINELLQMFHGSRFITTTDLSSASLQIGSQEESRKYTGFLFECRVCQYTRTPNGFRNFLAAIVRAVQTVLGPDTCDCTLVYLYDIVLHSPTLELHLEHLDTVLQMLTNAIFTVMQKNVVFAGNNLRFSGT